MNIHDFKILLSQQVLILDGAMGTMIQPYQLTEADFRGAEFAQWPLLLKGNNDILSLTKPEVIRQIQRSYLEAGADIIETNTFSLQRISMSEYQLESYIETLNNCSIRIARELADEFTAMTPHKPRFVAGSIGPTGKSASMSADMNDAAARSVTFDQLEQAYHEQIVIMIQGGVDLLLIETIFDTLNAKAAIKAAERAMIECGRELPIMLSLTISDQGGRSLSGQTLQAFFTSIMHTPHLLSVGLNCSFGAAEMISALRELASFAPCMVSAYPNAGLPNQMGQYDQSPELMAAQVKEYLEQGLVNIIGGCCGTTPEHIAAYVPLIEHAKIRIPQPPIDQMWLSGLERLVIQPANNFVTIGERCNVAGSRKFLRLLQQKEYDQAIKIAREQVEAGAQILDINMDDGLLDTKSEMVHFLRLLSSEPDIAAVPFMVDSSKWEVLEAGIKSIQGKSIVNSISLKNGEEEFIKQAQQIKSLGAAVVVMAFDEVGQADNCKRKIEICERAYRILTLEVGFNPYDIIFDPNILSIGTGMEEHNHYAVDFIEATKWIKSHLLGAKVSGGVSNLSFSFRGNNYIREAMHAVFLYHAIAAGMDMAIVNPNTTVTYEEIAPELLTLLEDLILDRNPHAAESLINIATTYQSQLSDSPKGQENSWREQNLDERLEYALRKGIVDYLESDINEAVQLYPSAVNIIEGPLMSGMNSVGQLFGQGKMFLPQVIKSARTMKAAVAYLQPYIDRQKQQDSTTSQQPTILIATVKGDVHDIGKNIVSVVMGCNNYRVIDLGVMVPAETIVEAVKEYQPDLIGLSGLITPSLEEMIQVVKALDLSEINIPIILGGATTSELHTALKIAPDYRGVVVHVRDASQNVTISNQLLQQPHADNQFIQQVKARYAQLRLEAENQSATLVKIEQARRDRVRIDPKDYLPMRPQELGLFEVNISIETLIQYINWRSFFQAWQIEARFASIARLHGCDSCRAQWLSSFKPEDRAMAAQAMQLHKEAMRLLSSYQAEESVTIKALYALHEAYSQDDTIIIKGDSSDYHIPLLRQQHSEGQSYICLSDFIYPQSAGIEDYIGAFAITVCGDQAHYKTDHSILHQIIMDRLVESASEWLHYKVRKDFWGYQPNENMSVEDMYKSRYQGIRPAVGYPSLPDQRAIFILDQILETSSIGISLTENGAMSPHSSVCGLYLAHPQSQYFRVGAIAEDQLLDYATRMHSTPAETAKYIPYK